ncbi:CLUMA_CG011251, isoform A [Clunio marinus]|uniref:CLUMA_CG011251, isoform A n=1 Tax=Clunio marinus TaxID=568069 RepID=A0A1J1IE93_9DIPT|nr:CLUMA_CG011251, isoform A [Clunio marinus]
MKKILRKNNISACLEIKKSEVRCLQIKDAAREKFRSLWVEVGWVLQSESFIQLGLGQLFLGRSYSNKYLSHVGVHIGFSRQAYLEIKYE